MEKYPRSSAELTDLANASRKFVLPGFVPEKPFLTKADSIWTIGSCFAVNILAALKAHGIKCANSELMEGVNSPPMLRLYLEGIASGVSSYVSAAEIKDVRAIIASAKGAILTFGLAVAPLTAQGTLAINAPGELKAISAAAAEADIAGAVQALKAINPDIHAFLTLSPVPLNRSFWSSAPVVADCVSKSTLRVALDQFLQTAPANVHYWPAFEIVRWLGAHRAGHYAADDGLQRHVSRNVVDVATGLFIESFFAA